MEHLTSAIEKLTINNKALVATNEKLAAEVTNLKRKLVRNAGGDTSGPSADKHRPSTYPHCNKEGFHKPDT